VSLLYPLPSLPLSPLLIGWLLGATLTASLLGTFWLNIGRPKEEEKEKVGTCLSL
jgi:hypothetical protein